MVTSQPATVVEIAAGLDDLERQNPVISGVASPHMTYEGDGFRVRHLAFDRGAVLPEHAAPLPVVITVVEGKVCFESEGEVYQLSQGAIIHFGAGVRHVVTAHEISRLVLILVGE